MYIVTVMAYGSLILFYINFNFQDQTFLCRLKDFLSDLNLKKSLDFENNDFI